MENGVEAGPFQVPAPALDTRPEGFSKKGSLRGLAAAVARPVDCPPGERASTGSNDGPSGAITPATNNRPTKQAACDRAKDQASGTLATVVAARVPISIATVVIAIIVAVIILAIVSVVIVILCWIVIIISGISRQYWCRCQSRYYQN